MSQKLTVTQIKKVRALIDKGITKCNEDVDKVEQMRNAKLFEVGNLLHEAVPISNDEVSFAGSFTFLLFTHQIQAGVEKFAKGPCMIQDFLMRAWERLIKR